MNEEKNIIPPITNPLGSVWKQPKVSEILIDDTHALMTKSNLDKLSDYSHSQPTGVYHGKMWKSCFVDKNNKIEGWHLVWFGKDRNGDPNYCSNNYRVIIEV